MSRSLRRREAEGLWGPWAGRGLLPREVWDDGSASVPGGRGSSPRPPLLRIQHLQKGKEFSSPYSTGPLPSQTTLRSRKGLHWFSGLPQQITTKGLEQQKRILSKFWRPEARNQGAAGPCLLQRVQGNILSHLFQLLWVTPGIPWPLHSHGFPFGVSVFSSASKLPLPFSYKDACHFSLSHVQSIQGDFITRF